MKLCVTANIIAKYGSMEEFGRSLDFLKRAGFEEIDFPFSTAMMLCDGWKETFREKMKLAREAGVPVRYAHMPFDYPREGREYGWDDFFTASQRAMEMAAEAGVDCAAIHPRTNMTREYNAEKEHEEALNFLAPYCEAAKRAGLMLAIENMRGPGQSAPKEIMRYATETDDLIRLADELECGICWDTGHANISAQPQRESLIKIGKRLKMVHLNDNFAEDDVHIAPFIGNVRWDEVAEGLKVIGYGGSLNFEVACRRVPEEVQKEYAAYMAAAARRFAGMMK